MTGPEHYQEAERLLGDADRADGIIVMPNPQALAAAQAHATLALAAATALSRHNFETGPPQADKDAWYRAASEGPAATRHRREAEAAEQREFAEEQQS